MGIDLRDGNPSLPVVLAMQGDPEVARLFRKPSLSESDIEIMMRRIEGSGALDEVRRLARKFAAKAREGLNVLPESGERQQLFDLVDLLSDRAS